MDTTILDFYLPYPSTQRQALIKKAKPALIKIILKIFNVKRLVVSHLVIAYMLLPC